ncbi:hypothetical protein [Rothia mucilaginosa]|uniref:hypothetical protein n=1 Tax=Rothia mucilaginosa TaxID=43675 RepID=UPI0028DB5006|nr:hypothetical protein [Rothia mucilaginosa]
MASYSSTPKPRRGHRRVSGGGSVSGAEPLLVGVTTPPVAGTSSAAGASVKKADAQNQNSQKAGAQKAAISAQPLTPEERERLEWMRQQRPPHWGNNIV